MASKTPHKPTVVIFVRHGQTPTTGKKLPGRAPGLHLAPKGIAQAQAAAERIGALSTVRAVYTSPMERTQETAAPIAKAHQFINFTTAPNLQVAVAYGLRKDDSYFNGLSSDLEAKRDLMAEGLGRIGFDVLDCAGTYFITTDFRPLGFNGDDVEFCRHITTEAGVAAVPVSAFYQGGEVRHFARFSFCKDDATLDEALARLSRHFGKG